MCGVVVSRMMMCPLVWVLDVVSVVVAVVVVVVVIGKVLIWGDGGLIVLVPMCWELLAVVE